MFFSFLYFTFVAFFQGFLAVFNDRFAAALYIILIFIFMVNKMCFFAQFTITIMTQLQEYIFNSSNFIYIFIIIRYFIWQVLLIPIGNNFPSLEGRLNWLYIRLLTDRDSTSFEPFAVDWLSLSIQAEPVHIIFHANQNLQWA